MEVDSANAIALKGLNDVAKALAQQARDAIANNDIDLANQRINDLAHLNPNNAAIPELRASISSRKTETPPTPPPRRPTTDRPSRS